MVITIYYQISLILNNATDIFITNIVTVVFLETILSKQIVWRRVSA